MKIFTRNFRLLLIALLCFYAPIAFGQSILNPNDSVLTYPANRPAQPPAGTIGRWIRTVRMSWNTNLWKCYIYNGMPFRLRFPLSYNPTANDGKVYPMMVFMHGEGEGGTVNDNEYSLLHGGQFFDQSVSNGTFDGYILVGQTTGGWGPPEMTKQQFLIDYMIAHNKLDPFRVTLNGLSGGGSGDWELFQSKETYIAGLIPMSSVAAAFTSPDTVNKWKFTPIWNIHGGKDGSPAPYTAQQVLLAMQAGGANYIDLNMTTQGHDTWDSTWSMPAFWPWMKAQYCSNPWALFGRTKFCPGNTINITVGVCAGFQQYQWRMNGTVIPGATTNTINVTALGTYDCRVMRSGIWSAWSPTPVVVQNPPTTVTPPITVSGLMSKVIPVPDGNAGVTLAEPSTYATYNWQKVGSSTTLGTLNTYYPTSPGQYICTVTEQYGCSATASAPFTVVDANGPNKPDPATGLVATPISKTAMQLNWTQNPFPNNNETNFEVYQATTSGGPYKLIHIKGADVGSDTAAGLIAAKKYYFIVRAVNNTGASANSNEANAATVDDIIPPTVPGNVAIIGGTRTSISMKWSASTDNVGVANYNIYMNGTKTNVVAGNLTTFTANGLTYQQNYKFYITAVDAAGNESPASGQVSGQAELAGFTYQYFNLTGTVTTLPNYSRTTVTSTGGLPNITLSPATQTTNFGFLFQGYLIVTTAGTYNFQLTSSDGSKLYLGALNSSISPYNSTGTALVSNDGVHSTPTTVTSANTTLSVGLYPIAIAYFKGSSGSASLGVSWKTPGSSSFVTIPNSAFNDPVANNGQAPPAPTNPAAVAQSYYKVGLTWTDNSGGQATTEVWRSTSPTTGFVSLGFAAAGVSSFVDSTASGSTLYYYQMRADNLYGQSPFSANASATTPPPPTVPTAPTGVIANVTTSSVALSWNAVANANSIVLFRSFGTNQQYVQWAVLPGTATSFADNGLFANATYFYKLQAVNAGGSSPFSTEISATTLGNPPVISKLPSTEHAKIGTTTTFNVSATSVNSSPLTLTAFNLPAFASFTDNGNKTGVLTVTPTAANAGTYPGLYIVVKDGFGFADTTTFSLVVDNNVAPVLNNIANYTINEGDTLTIPLSGSNTTNPGDVLSFAVANGPGGSVLTPVSNGAANLFEHPGFAAAGTYNVQVTLNDNTNGLSATTNFTLTVKDKNPMTKIFTRVVYNDAGALGLPWNSLQGTTTNNLLDSSGNATGVGLQFSPTTWWNTFNGGPTTGNNSGVYPDVVLQDYSWFGSLYGGPDVVNGTVTGTDTSQLYDLTFFASSVYSGFGDNGTTTYSSGGQTVALHVQNNRTQTVTLQGLKPATNGSIPFSMGLQGSNTTQLGYFNALVITKHYDDGSAPAGISGLTATRAQGRVSLNWTDSAYNATGYEVWRALTSGGSYSLLNTVGGNAANSYADSSVAGNTGYNYIVRAVNTHGNSPFDTVSVVTLGRLPKINAIQNVILKNNQSTTVNVTTVDDATAVLTLTASNLPPFVTFVDNGNGTGVLTVAPSAGAVGIYPNVSVTVEDQLDSTASTSFSIAVTEPNVQSVYVNFTGGQSCPAPWNTLLTAPFTGSVMSNLLDDGGTPTGISATLVDGWYWFGVTGTANGNTNGNQPSQLTYPSPVTGNFIFEPTTASRRIQFSGLDNTKLYNFVFFNSMWDGTNGLTNFTINGTTVSLQADWNINRTVQINAVTPVGGVVTVTVQKATGAANGYLNAIVLQAYDATPGNLLSPADLRALTITQTTAKLQWQDRSAIETGYEVWRASDNSGSYSLIASLPAQSTTYQDNGLSRNANYYYIVRAVNGGSFSNYSAPLAITTYQDAVYVHPQYNSAGIAPTPPWNNLNSTGRVGASWSNWIDSTGPNSGIGMVQTGAFAGPNSLGDVTGNNSGVYPDPVILQHYVLFPGNIGSFTVNGLNLGKTYDFTFFGSESYETGNQLTGYAVNGDTVYLNCLYNQQATVTLHGVQPTATGQAFITMFCPGTSIAGWFNAMVINGYTPVTQHAPTVPTGGSNTTLRTTTAAQFAVPQSIGMDTVVRAYPNPFHTNFTLSVPVFSDNEKVIVALFDVNGRLVYRKEFDNVASGMNYLQIGQDGQIGAPGTYVGKVMFSSGRPSQVVQLIKK